MRELPLEIRFAEALRDLGVGDRPRNILVAVSGGLDSTVLLHLFRFRSPLPHRLTVAHFDHRMRPESAADADWVSDLSHRWNLPLEAGVADAELRGETDAREARYAFLFATAGRTSSQLIATAHHADDQAETVLFRILRGTGLAGLSGIPRRTRAGLIRPMLSFWREEIQAYAEANSIEWRHDASNDTLGPVRNRVRTQVLPALERDISKDARRQLVSLAELARESEAGWRSIVASAWKEVVTSDGDALVLSRSNLSTYHRALAIRLVRDAIKHFGVVPSRFGTRSALQFITQASSGRVLQMPGGVRIRIEFDAARVERTKDLLDQDKPLSVDRMDEDSEQSGRVNIGGCSYRVVISRRAPTVRGSDSGAIWSAQIPVRESGFPLLLRGRRAGDCILTSGGTKSLKKLMIERRVPLHKRSQLPVLQDEQGSILWVAGLETGLKSETADSILNLAIYAE